MILIWSLRAWLEQNNPIPVFLPFAIWGFLAAIAFGLGWLAWLLLDRRKGSPSHRSSSKGATP